MPDETNRTEAPADDRADRGELIAALADRATVRLFHDHNRRARLT